MQTTIVSRAAIIIAATVKKGATKMQYKSEAIALTVRRVESSAALPVQINLAGRFGSFGNVMFRHRPLNCGNYTASTTLTVGACTERQLRSSAIILVFYAFSALPYAFGQGVTIVQLGDFLRAQHKSRRPDNETAGRLSSTTLSERLTEQELNRVTTENLARARECRAAVAIVCLLDFRRSSFY
jgi:hypothetical protein